MGLGLDSKLHAKKNLFSSVLEEKRLLMMFDASDEVIKRSCCCSSLYIYRKAEMSEYCFFSLNATITTNLKRFYSNTPT